MVLCTYMLGSEEVFLRSTRVFNVSKSKRYLPPVWSAGVAVSLLAGSVAVAHADDSQASRYLFGDWGGEREVLADKGVTFDFGYLSEAAHNTSGGARQITRYADQWMLGTKVDLGKAFGWSGTTFRMLVTDRNGRDLGSDAGIGNNQLIQETYGRGETWYLSEFSLEKKLFDGRLTAKAGRMMIGTDFATFSCDFQNLTFCGAQPGNIVGSYWLNIPVSVWSAVIKYQTGHDSYLQVGGYQVNPKYTDSQYGERRGLQPTFPGGTTGALIPLEFGWTPSLAGLPGSYKLGGWYNSSRTADVYANTDREALALAGGAALEHNGTYGGYLSVQQQVSGVAGGDGLNLFLNVSQADRRTAETNGQINLGLEYKGIFGRSQDMLGFGIGGTHINSRYAAYVQQHMSVTGDRGEPAVGAGYEYASEVFYSWSPAPYLTLRPNLQYIVHPGGTRENDNAFVVGLKTLVSF